MSRRNLRGVEAEELASLKDEAVFGWPIETETRFLDLAMDRLVEQAFGLRMKYLRSWAIRSVSVALKRFSVPRWQ